MVVLLCASWGLYQASVKIATAGISPVMQTGLRCVGATLLLMLWCRLRGVALWQRDGTLWLGLAAGFMFAFEFVLIYWGFALTSVGRGVLCLYAAPFVVAIGAHFFAGERLTWLKAGGLLAAFGGLLVVFRDSLGGPVGEGLAGDLMLLAAAVVWGATTVMIKGSRLARISAEKILFYQLGISALVQPPLSVVLGEPGVFDPTPVVLIAVAYQTVLIAFVSYLAWFWLITRYPASHLSAFTFLTPVFAIFFGWLLLDEPITAELIAAAALVAVGIYAVNRPARAAP
jgi:drug/metabolite transporter (DMT)-like permease